MKFHSLRSEELIGGVWFLERRQLAPSPLVRMFRERYKPPPQQGLGQSPSHSTILLFFEVSRKLILLCC